jgi:phenylalanine-4-hydroxylase
VMRTRYRIDDFQQTYFVIDNFQELFDATRPDFAPIYREIAAQADLEPDALIGSDRKFDQAASGRLSAGKKMGRRLSAAQV